MNWISVKESLPAEHVDVLVWNGAEQLIAHIAGYWTGEQSWYDSKTHEQVDVTHWQLLPEDPKEYEIDY